MLTKIQTVTFDSWEHYHGWETHIQGATALLELRGQEQFSSERGGQLFIQLRTQIVSGVLSLFQLAHQSPSLLTYS